MPETKKVRVAIIGATAYTSRETLRWLLGHPQAELVTLCSRRDPQPWIADVFPEFAGRLHLQCEPIDPAALKGRVDLALLCLPNGIAMTLVPDLLAAGVRVIDFGPDYRLKEPVDYQQWYDQEHTDLANLAHAVYGLTEFYREKIRPASLVANPGCYPTAAILGLAPLVKEKLVDSNSLIVDAKSGISGAGRGVSLKVHFCERNEGIAAYAVTTHRHMGEIEYQLSKVAGQDLAVTFVPHLTPMNRGILATCYAKLVKPVKSVESVILAYKEFYKGQAFVRIYESGEPCTKNVAGTNFCDIGVAVNEVTGTVIVMSCIDNLIKGAAGQAVQNMNLILGYPEEEGLKSLALYP